MPRAFEMIEERDAHGHRFGEGCREAGRHALGRALEGRMGGRVERHLEALARRGEAECVLGSDSAAGLADLLEDRPRVSELQRRVLRGAAPLSALEIGGEG